MRRTATGAAFLLVLLIWTGTPGATQIIFQSPQQMGMESVLVVRGRVADVHSYWNESRTKIYTETVIAVDETYKGDGAPTVRVVQPGGVVGNRRMHVHGAVQWKFGEEVLLFLEPLSRGRHRVAGFSQGRFDIERDPATGSAFVVHPALDGIDLVGAPSGDGASGAGRAGKTPLEQFVQQALGQR
jgi:hypothetical protein